MALLKLGNGLFNAPEVTAHATRQPVVLAQTVEHRPPDTLRRIGFKLRPHARFEASQGIKQSEHTVLHQILDLNAGRQACHQVIGDPLDEWGKTLHQLIFVDLTSSVVHGRGNHA